MAPSFEEMSEAIDDLVRTDNQTAQVDSVAISVQQQIVLSCAWLNLKVIIFTILYNKNYKYLFFFCF